MTLIASIIPQGCAILLGDLLTSSKRQPPYALSIPTVGKLPENLKLSDERFIVGTAQKLCVVNPRLAVAWANGKFQAEDIISKMKTHFSRRKITKELLIAFFNAQDQKVMKDLQLIMWIRNGDKLESFGVNTYFLDTEEYGHCIFGGSGAGDLISLIYREREYDFMQGEPEAHSLAVSHAIQIAISIIGHEILTGQTLALYYGGGIEFLTFMGSRYEKVGDILYMYMDYDENTNDNFLKFVPFVYKMDYRKDNLIIRRLEMFLIDKRNGKHALKSYETYVIPPIIRRNKNIYISLENLPNLSATYFCCTVRCRNKQGKTIIRSTVQYSPERDNPLKIIRSRKGFLVNLDLQFFKNVFEKAKSEFGAGGGTS